MRKLAAKRWVVRPERREHAIRLSQVAGITPITAQLLINRGIDTPEAVREFLSPSTSSLHSPFEMRDMLAAVTTIRDTVEKGLPIAIYGDYDVDGITGTAVLLRTFARLGIPNVDFYIPDRLVEGYGVNEDAVRELAARGCKLIVTVDCGVTAHREVELAKSLGVDIVITDHHQPGPELPTAKGVVNPHRADCAYPFSDLAGVGVAFKLAQALLCSLGHEPEDWSVVGEDLLDLVALGTVADVVPMYGENRVIVKFGLEKLAFTDKVGLQALLRSTSLLGEKLTADHIGYILAPRINALGRLANAGKAVELLTTTEEALADAIASDLNGYNTERREVESRILAEAVDLVESEGMATDNVLVLAKNGWHHGVIGIVASRLVERYYRPVVMISLDEGIGKGSARSIPGFDLFSALQLCDDLLEAYGGHTMAAGLTIQEAAVPALRRRLNAVAGEWLTPEDFVPCLTADVEVSLDQLSLNLLEELTALEPFGEGNPVPIMVSRNVPLRSFRVVGKDGGHLSLGFATRTGEVRGIFFGRGDLESSLTGLTNLDIAYIPMVNEWNGSRSVQVNIQDIAVSSREMRVGFLARLAASVDRLDSGHAYEKIHSVSDAHSYVAAASETEKPQERMMWYDGRGEDKGAYLKSLLIGSTNQVVIWVNRPSYAVLLASNIQDAFPALAGSVTAWSHRWPEALREEIIEENEQQPWRVVVTDAPLLPSDLVGPNPDFVVYHIPPEAAWLDSLALQCEGHDGQLHLLYNESDKVQACRMLKSAWPDAEHLRMLYVAVSRAVGTNGKAEIGSLYSELSQRCRLLPTGIDRGLAVLADLGLCRSESGSLAMKPAPEKKLDLCSSLTYNEIVFAVNSAQSWFTRALSEDVETLRNFHGEELGRGSLNNDSLTGRS